MENNDKKVEELKKEIESIKEDIDKIQSECRHLNSKVCFDSESKSVKKICTNCQKVIGIPSELELKENGFI